MKDNLDIRLDDGTECETLFKVVHPLTEVHGGYGYNGVLLRRVDDGKIQCHICGRFFDSMGRHSQAAHETPAAEYRYKFGLPLTFPLCSHKVSARTSATATEHSLGNNLAEYRRRHPDWQSRAKSRKWRKNRDYGLHSASFENKRGACKAQMAERYAIVCDAVGKEASLGDVQKMDPPLRDLIFRRYGGMENFKQSHGYTPVDTKYKREWDRRGVVAWLRKYFMAHGHPPSSGDIRGKADHGYPGYNSIRRIFGSWSRALACAGFEMTSIRFNQGAGK